MGEIRLCIETSFDGFERQGGESIDVIGRGQVRGIVPIECAVLHTKFQRPQRRREIIKTQEQLPSVQSDDRVCGGLAHGVQQGGVDAAHCPMQWVGIALSNRGVLAKAKNQRAKEDRKNATEGLVNKKGCAGRVG